MDPFDDKGTAPANEEQEYGDIFGVEEEEPVPAKKEEEPKEPAESESEQEEPEVDEEEVEVATVAVAAEPAVPPEPSPEPEPEPEPLHEQPLEEPPKKKPRKKWATEMMEVPKVDSNIFKAMNVSEPEDDDEKNYPTIYDNDLDTVEEKSWREPDADITDWFNYGFNENTWREYCAAQVKIRLSQSRRKETDRDVKKRRAEHPGAVPSMSWKRPNPAERGICFEFQNKGTCSRGPTCRWRHSLDAKPSPTQNSGISRGGTGFPTIAPRKDPPMRGGPVRGGPVRGPVRGGLMPPGDAANVQEFMKGLIPPTALIGGRSSNRESRHRSRDKHRKRSRYSRSPRR